MTKPTGRRKITPSMMDAYLCAQQWCEHTCVEKKRAVCAFNRAAAPVLKLNAQAIELMNKLLSFSQAQDWASDSRPIVWPDNRRLIGECSFERAALQRNLRRLSEAGLIAFRDSPKGQRFGRRNTNGKIILAATYGIDLSPLALQTPALERAAADLQTAADEYRHAARRFTCRRKMIASIIETAIEYQMHGPWEDATDQLQAIMAARSGINVINPLLDLCELLDQLHEQVQTAYAAVAGKVQAEAKEDPLENAKSNEDPSKMRPMSLNSDALIQNTIQKYKTNLYSKRRSACADQLIFEDAGFTGKDGKEKKPAVIGVPEHSVFCSEPQITCSALLSLCPNFAEHVWAPDGPNWQQVLFTVEHIIRPHLEVPLSTWMSACRNLGRERAVIAIAILFEKHETGLIKSPGAYLNGMVSKAKVGDLHLSSSLFHRRLQTSILAGQYLDRGKSVARS
ncbi:plasmid replication protein RepC [Rhizobium sp.]|jgi:replication initiation protein RepC|uniref:plasmid replication protein RepC n=1 Tax=Rhizobium sp. TaxID=391 RepID=UPI000E833797|nr:hypothetical protein [Rhizobium sp.]